MHDPRISYFAKTNFRNQGITFGIKQADRLSHMHIIGKTGTGKSTLLETLFDQDVQAGRGCALIDPHGDLAARVAARIPTWRTSDLVYVNLPDPNQPFGYNPLTHVSSERRSLVASGIMELFEKMWPLAWGQRMEHILRNSLLAYSILQRPTSPIFYGFMRTRTFDVLLSPISRTSKSEASGRRNIRNTPIDTKPKRSPPFRTR